MNDNDPDRVDPATAAADQKDAARRPGADRPPTPDETRLAESAARELADEMPQVAEHYEEMNRIGAAVQGEGEVPG